MVPKTKSSIAATSTANASLTKYNKILKKANRFKTTDEISKLLIDAGINILESYSFSEKASFNSVEISEELKLFIPSSESIIGSNLFDMPCFPLVFLHEIAELYGFNTIEDEFMNNLKLASSDLNNNRILSYVWFSYFLECSPESTRSVVDKYKNSRNPNLVINNLEKGRDKPLSTPVHVDYKGKRTTDSFSLNTSNLENPLNLKETSNESIKINLKQNELLANKNFNIQDEESTDQNIKNEFSTEKINLYKKNHDDGNIFIDENGKKYYNIDPEFNRNMADPNTNNKAANIATIFKSKKFSGSNLTESIEKTLRYYEIVCKQQNLGDSQKSSYFIHALEDPAESFFIESFSDNMTFDDIKTFMLKEYNKDGRQIQIQSKLDSLRIGKFMRDKNISDFGEGLTKLVEEIQNLTPQCQEEFRTDAHKIKTLRKAVAECSSWSKTPIQSISTQRYTFNDFVTALHESLQTELELFGHQQQIDEFQTNIGQYANHPQSTKRHTRFNHNNERKRRFDNQSKEKKCYRCGGPYFRGHRCEKGAINSYFRSRIQNGENKVHIIAEIVKQLEGENETFHNEDGCAEGGSSNLTNDDLTEFDEITKDGDLDDNYNDIIDENHISQHFTGHVNSDHIQQDFHYGGNV